MWICTKNNQMINTDKVKSFSIKNGKNYYDDNAVLKTYQYILADDNKIIKLGCQEDAICELESIKGALSKNIIIYIANGIIMNEDENGNLID